MGGTLVLAKVLLCRKQGSSQVRGYSNRDGAPLLSSDFPPPPFLFPPLSDPNPRCAGCFFLGLGVRPRRALALRPSGPTQT